MENNIEKTLKWLKIVGNSFLDERVRKVLTCYVWEYLKVRNKLGDDMAVNYALESEISRKILDKINIGIKVIGEENIPEKGPVAIFSPHVSEFDIIAILAGIKRPVSFLAAEVMWNFALNRYLKAIDCIKVVRQHNSRKEGIEEMRNLQKNVRKHYEEGKAVVTFPEGKLISSKEAESDGLGRFRSGTFRVAVEEDITTVPMNIKGTECINVTSDMKRYTIPETEIVISVGEPFKPSELGIESSVEMSNVTRNRILKLR